MKLKTIIILGIICLMAVGCAKKEGEVIKIGVASALTGAESALGQDVANAVKLAVEEANTKGDLPKKLEVFAYDDKSDPKDAVTVANIFAIDKDVVGVVGHLVSGCTLPASKIYSEADLAMITPSATNPAITKQGFKNVFRTCVTDDVQGLAAGEFVIRNLKKKKVAIIHDKTPYGQGLAEEFQKSIKARGGTVLAFEGITPREMDYSAVLTKIKPKNPEVIYFGGMYNEASLLAKQIVVLNIKTVFMGGDGLYVPEFIRLAGKSSEGVVVSFLAPPYDKIETAKGFVSKFNAKYGEIKTYAPYAYDAANIIIEALRKTIKLKGTQTKAVSTKAVYDYDRKEVIKAISNTKNYKGITGSISFDKKGDVVSKKIYFYRVKNGKFEWVKE